MRYSSLAILFSPLIVFAQENNFEKEFNLQQQLQYQQQDQDNKFIQNDNFLTTIKINQQEFTIENNIEDVMTALFIVINHKQTQDIENLLKRYKQFPEAENGMILFSQANIEFNNGNTKQAIQLYEQLIKNDPDFIRGKLDLARLYFLDWQNKNAKNLFNQINLPNQPNVMENVSRFMQQIDRRQAWRGSFSVGGIYNNNLNQSGKETAKEIVFDPNFGLLELTRSRPTVQKGYGWTFEASLNKHQVLKNHHGVIFKGLAYGERYPKKAEFSEYNVSAALGYRFQNQHHQLDFSPIFEKTYAQQAWYSQRRGVQLSYAQTRENAYFRVQLEYKTEQYQRVNLNYHNGKILSVFNHIAYSLPNDWLLFGGVDYLRKFGTTDKADQYQRTGVRIGVNKTFEVGAEFTAQAIFRQTRYRAFNALLNKTRRDNEQKYLLNLALPKLAIAGFTPNFSVTHTRHQSNVPLVYGFKQNEVAVKLEKFF